MLKKLLLFVVACIVVTSTACSLGGSPNSVPTSTPTLTPTLLATNTPLGVEPTLVPTLASGGLLTDATPTSMIDCLGSFQSRLTIGSLGRVMPGLPNALRTQPVHDGTRNNVIGSIPAGNTFQVVAGPACDSGLIFWKVSYRGMTGWTAEGDTSSYYVEPLDSVGGSTTTSDCPGSPAARLTVGGNGKVMPGDPNILRSSAGLSGVVVGRMPAGSVFSVIDGPECRDNLRWWEVMFNGQTGWTAEGQDTTYWLQPYVAQ